MRRDSKRNGLLFKDADGLLHHCVLASAGRCDAGHHFRFSLGIIQRGQASCKFAVGCRSSGPRLLEAMLPLFGGDGRAGGWGGGVQQSSTEIPSGESSRPHGTMIGKGS